MTDAPEPIAPDRARELLHAAIRERLGENWADELNGWAVVSQHDYMARLTRGRTNIDFYVDLVGKVTIEEKAIDPGRENGRMVAWALLLASLAVALTLARIAGVL